MLIVSDIGEQIVNTDETFCFDTAKRPEGSAVVAFGPGINTVLCIGSEQRVRQCLATIIKAHKEGWKVLDLGDVIGQRPNLQVAQMIQLPNNGARR